jgi:antitoxin HigA-1
MSKREKSEYKLAPEEMAVAMPPADRHPGEFIKQVLLPEYGLSVSEAARRIAMDRATLHLVLTGKHAVSRDLAYKLGALMRDEVADLLIAAQLAFDLAQEQERREAFRRQIERMPEPA